MPVLDHEVHERVRVGEGHRPGCWNKPRPKTEAEGGGYWAPDRTYAPDGSFIRSVDFIPHRMSSECRYDMSLSDPRCDGCQHRGSGEAYSRSIMERAR